MQKTVKKISKKKMDGFVEYSKLNLENTNHNKSVDERIKELNNDILTLSKTKKEVKDKYIMSLTMYKISTYGYVSSIQWDVKSITEDKMIVEGKNDDGYRGYKTTLEIDRLDFEEKGFYKATSDTEDKFYLVDIFKNDKDKIEFILDALTIKKSALQRDIKNNEESLKRYEERITLGKTNLKSFDDVQDKQVLDIFKDLSFVNASFGFKEDKELLDILPRKITI